MKAYRSRYINALKKAAAINRYRKKGYRVFFDGSPTTGRFVMNGDELLFQVTPQFSYLFYQNSKYWDHGYWTPIKKWNEDFHARFEVFEPSAKVF